MLILDDEGRVDVPARFRKTWSWEPESATLPSWVTLGGSAQDANMTNEFITAAAGIPGLKITTDTVQNARASIHGPQINLNQQGLVAVRLSAFVTGGADATNLNMLLNLSNENLVSPVSVGASARHVNSPRAVITTYTAAGSVANDSTIDNHAFDRMSPGTGIRQRNDMTLWIDVKDKRAYYGRRIDEIDFQTASTCDLGVIDPMLRVTTRTAGVTNYVVIHRFRIDAWYE